MPWGVKWFLHSDERDVTAEERAALLAHARQEEAHPWQIARYVLGVLGGRGLVAGGATTVPDDLAHPDWALLLAALTSLRKLVPGTRCEVADDLGVVAWNEAARRYETSGWQHAASARAAAPEPPAEAERPVRELYARLTGRSVDGYTVRRTLVDEHDPVLVARIGMELLPTIPHEFLARQRSDVAGAVHDALEKVTDLAPLAASIRTLWQARPDDDLVRHIASALEPAASQPLVLDLACAALIADDTDASTMVAMCDLLRFARGAAEQVVPLLVARARRDRAITGREVPWRERLVCALEVLRRPEGFATLLLEGDVDPQVMWRTMSGVAACDGARSLPYLERMIGTAGVSTTSIVRAIADLRAPGAVELLLRFVDSPEGEVRAVTATALFDRKRLAEAASIWRTLDAAGFTEHDYVRERLLRELGSDAKGEVDWDALLRAHNLEPIPVAPLPSPLDCLTHPSIDARNAARHALEKRLDPRHLRAIAISALLEEEVGRQGYPRAYPSFWKWRELLAAKGVDHLRDEEIAAWVRAHADELPPQELTPALEALRDGGLAEAAARCEARPFRLTDEERAALDAEEAEVAARASIAAADPEPVEAADLFEGVHAEIRGEAMDPRRAEYPLGLEPSALRLVSHAQGGLVEIPDGQAQVTVQRRDGLCGFLFEAIVKRRARWVRFDALEVVLRDARGAPLLAVARTLERHLRPAGRIGLDGHLERSKLDEVRRVDARAVLREPLQLLAGRWLLGRIADDALGRCALEPVSSSEVVRAQATAHVTRGRYVELDVTAELALAQPALTVSHLRVAIAVRGEQGAILTSGHDDVVLPADGSGAIVQRLLGLDPAKARAARWLDVAVRGARTIAQPLATFEP